ncbi:hypothetical protein [Desulfovibrio oxyclinae]|uniref:hypothetical protein n=1 Tax=Desulfovibrio oxyclinae TaxID=63560 RepID=UPI00036F4B05|nr:hypothetical protein [Desulfovibrio oxyclinae]
MHQLQVSACRPTFFFACAEKRRQKLRLLGYASAFGERLYDAVIAPGEMFVPTNITRTCVTGQKSLYASIGIA